MQGWSQPFEAEASPAHGSQGSWLQATLTNSQNLSLLNSGVNISGTTGLCKPYTLPWKGACRNTGIHPLTPLHLVSTYHMDITLPIVFLQEWLNKRALTPWPCIYSLLLLYKAKGSDCHLCTNYWVIRGWRNKHPCFALVSERGTYREALFSAHLSQ